MNRMTHPRHGTVDVADALVDRYRRRGFEPIARVEELDYRGLQALARERGIPANQKRDALLKALR